MKKFYTLSTLILLVTLVGCNKFKDQPHGGDGLVTIQMTLGISGYPENGATAGAWQSAQSPALGTLPSASSGTPTTKAPILGTSFPEGTSDIGLFFMKADGTTPYSTGTDNMVMRITVTGGTATWKYYLNDGVTELTKGLAFDRGESVTLWGYYPRVATGITPTSIPFDGYQTGDQDIQNDFLYCPKRTIEASNAQNLPMIFNHGFAMLEFNIRAKIADPAKIASCSFYVPDLGEDPSTMPCYHGEFDPSTGLINNRECDAEILANYSANNDLEAGTYKSFRIVIPPFTAADCPAISMNFSIENGDGSASDCVFFFTKDYLSNNTSLVAGTKYTFNVTYLNDGKGGLILDSWNSTTPINGLPGQYEPTIMEFGGVNGTTVESGMKAGYKSYNDLVGEIGQPGGNNGIYSTGIAQAYANEPGYYKLEVDKCDIYQPREEYVTGKANLSWRDVRDIATMDGDICKKRRGADWRMPRYSELKLMALNRAALETTPGFTSFMNGDYNSASETSNINCIVVNLNNNTQSIYFPKANGQRPVRCVRELPLTPVIMEFDVAPMGSTTDPFMRVYGASYESYNAFKGFNDALPNGLFNDINGQIQTTEETVLRDEPPYYKLEIDSKDLYDGNNDDISWLDMRNPTTMAGDICTSKRGPQWRMPRASELMLMALNKDAINRATTPGFEPMFDNTPQYWSASQVDAEYAWICSSAPATLGTSNVEIPSLSVRCVRETDPVAPTIMVYGESPYGDKITDVPAAAQVPTYYQYWGLGATNGAMYDSEYDAFAEEGPYPILEIDKKDLLGPDNYIEWLNAQKYEGTDLDICKLRKGRLWRLPRLSEMKMISNNSRTLLTTAKFESFGWDYYISGTQSTPDLAWLFSFDEAIAESRPHDDLGFVRCVRERRN